MEKERFAVNVFVVAQMLDARAQQVARSPDDSVDRVAFSQEQFRKIRTVLSSNAGNQRSFQSSTHGFGETFHRRRCFPQDRSVCRALNRTMRLVLVVTAAALATVAAFAEQPRSAIYKGMTVSCQTWGIEWQTPEMEATLDELKSLGVNSIAIHPYAQVREDGHVVSGRRAGAMTSHITTPLRWAHERGMSAMLIPHIAYWGTKFSWRGEINFVTPEEWGRFFSDYEKWIVQMATLAESEHAEVLCVGLEFTYAQKFEERWRKIIAAVRAVYHGKITYGANW